MGGVCSSKQLRNQARIKNYQPDLNKINKHNKSYVPFSQIEPSIYSNNSMPIQEDYYENYDEQDDQMKWIKQIIYHYREGDEAPKKQIINQVVNSHHANSFSAVGRVISVFNDDIVYNEKSFYYGTGSIINQRIVLTAAHVLRHGVLNVLADYVYFELQNGPDKPKKYIQIKRYGFHRNFVQFEKDGKQKQSQKHDIAVLILQENNIITPQMTLGVQLNYKFTKQSHPEALVSGYPNHLNIGTEPFKQFWAEIKPSSALHNFLLYQNLLGGGFSGSPLMIKAQKNSKQRFNVFAVHKGQIGTKGYSVCLNSRTNKLNELLKHFSIDDTTNYSCFAQSIQRVKEFENTIETEEKKLFYQSEILFIDDIRWSKQKANKLELKEYLQKLQQADSFKKEIQQLKYSIYSLFKQVDQQNRCLFRYNQWKYVFELFKNLYLNDEEQQKLLMILLRMMNLNFQFDQKIDISEQCRQIGDLLHYLWNSTHFKTRTWCKQQGQNTQNNLNQKNQKIVLEISEIIKKGYLIQIDFEQRKKIKNQCLLWFYYNNKNYEKADKLAHTISTLQQQENPNILYLKGCIMSQISDLQKAQEYLYRYLKFVQKDGLLSFSSQANVYHQIGIVYQNQGKYNDALAFYKRSLQLKQLVNGKQSISCADTLNNMGIIYENTGRFNDALSLYERSLQITQKMKGKESLGCAIILVNIGLVYQNQRKYAEAISFYNQSLFIYEKCNGKDSIDCVVILNSMGVIYKDQGKYQEAIAYYKRSLSIYERVKGKDSILCASFLTNIGVVYGVQKMSDEAIAFYRRSLQIYEKINGGDDINWANTLNNIGLTLHNQGKYDQALSFLKRSHQMNVRVKGQNTIDCANTLTNIGLVYQHQDKFEDAITFYNRSLLIFKRINGQDSIQTVNTLNNIGVLYNDKGKYDQALTFFKKLLQIKQKVKGKISQDSAVTLATIGQVYRNQKKYKDAHRFYKQSLQIYEKVKGKNSIEYAAIIHMIGTTNDLQGKYKDAVTFYKRFLQIYQKLNLKDSPAYYNTQIDMIYVQNKLKWN